MIILCENPLTVANINENEQSKRKQHLNAHRLLREVLAQKYGIQKATVIYDENGKPFLADTSGIYISISHSGKAAAVAVADKPCGVDIEEIREVRNSLKQRVCRPDEYEGLNSNEDFIKLWTLKEAYMKMDGAGLSYGPRNVVIDGESVFTTVYEGYAVSTVVKN